MSERESRTTQKSSATMDPLPGQISLNDLIAVATDSVLRAAEARKVETKLGFPRIWIGIWVDIAGQRAEFLGREMDKPQ